MEKYYSNLNDFKTEQYYKDFTIQNPANFIYYDFEPIISNTLNTSRDVLIITDSKLEIRVPDFSSGIIVCYANIKR